MESIRLCLLTACLVLGSAQALGGSEGQPSWMPPKQTDLAEQVAKSEGGVSPMPTSQPDLGQMELFRRADYVLPSDYCGWYAEWKSNTFTCDKVSASCINIGSLRGCCDTSTSLCSSTFPSACIPSSSLVGSSASCASGTTCCSQSKYPQCGTIFMSSSAAPQSTYTMIQCWESTFSSTYLMQDYPPELDSSTTTATATQAAPTKEKTTTTSPTSTGGGASNPSGTAEGQNGANGDTNGGSSTPVGAIVGGVVGGVAVIALVALGVFFIMRKNRNNSSKPADTAAQSQPMMAQYAGHGGGSPGDGGLSPGPPGYVDARYSQYAGAGAGAAPGAGYYKPGEQASTVSSYTPTTTMYAPTVQSHSPDPQMPQGVYMQPGGQPMYGGHPQQQQGGQQFHVGELPTNQPVGTNGNRAELS